MNKISRGITSVYNALARDVHPRNSIKRTYTDVSQIVGGGLFGGLHPCPSERPFKVLSIEDYFRLAGIIPNVIQTAPQYKAKLNYIDVPYFKTGTVIPPYRSVDIPEVSHPGKSSNFFTVIMMDIDAPGENDTGSSNWLHWIVGNVPGSNVRLGNTRVEYLPPAPPPGTGYHRYLLLVYQQHSKFIYQTDEIIRGDTLRGRCHFDLSMYCEEHELFKLYAGTWFQSSFDYSVLDTYLKLNLWGN